MITNAALHARQIAGHLPISQNQMPELLYMYFEYSTMMMLRGALEGIDQAMTIYGVASSLQGFITIYRGSVCHVYILNFYSKKY